MQGFNDFLYKYGLHDCRVDNVFVKENNICFFFESGIYKLDSNVKETQKTNSCKMIVRFEHLCSNRVWEHVQVYKERKKKVKEISFEQFIKYVIKENFDITINYYSYFCNTILLKGYTKNFKCNVVISEITDIEFMFN